MESKEKEKGPVCRGKGNLSSAQVGLHRLIPRWRISVLRPPTRDITSVSESAVDDAACLGIW